PDAAAGRLFDAKVAVQPERLRDRERRVRAVEMTPPRLDDRDARREVRKRRAQEVPRRDEVSVEDRDELASRRGESLGKRPGLESCPHRAAAGRPLDAPRTPLR